MSTDPDERLARCDECRFWVREQETRHGKCRRFPQWVHTEFRDWCGEFRPPAPSPEEIKKLYQELGMR